MVYLLGMNVIRGSKSNLEGQIVLLSNFACQFNDCLHPSNLSFDHFVEILGLDVREQKEVDRTSISSIGCFRDKWP